jgi:2-phosphosulfolactate phosphatase
MNIEILHGHTFPEAKGVCIVIDVLRAFTTAAFAFDAGAKEIHFVSTIEEAFKKREEDPKLLLMGELEGVIIEGFQFGNSPHQLHTGDVGGKTLVQRTTSGTQGVVGCSHAEHIFATSFVIADATVQQVRALNPTDVTIIATGRKNGDEDLALAEYLKQKLLGLSVELDPLLERVHNSPCAERMVVGPTSYVDGAYDIQLATQINRFPFAIRVHKENGRLIGRKTLS